MHERRVTQSDHAPNANRASGSSFYAAMRILPRAQREAMFAIYGFCRQVDDIADSSAPREERLAELAAWRIDIKALYGGQAYGRTHDLAQPVATYRLDQADFLSIIDGMEMDVLADIRAPAWDDLDVYCDRVASAVGRLSVRIFGLEAKPGRKLAYHLGRALQLTNILRDLDEDAAVGRLYLPREALDRAGIKTDDPATALASPALDRACAQLVKAARHHFDEAGAIMSACSRRAVRAPRIMGEVYRLILERMAARGFFAPRRPIRIGRLRLIWILTRYAFI
jgi:presqualene diphosphate synthase